MSLKISLLIVEEDTEQARGLVASLLGDCPDREIVAARTGLKGLSRLRQESPDVVLLDCTDADARAAAMSRWLHEKALELPVVILTGNSWDVVLRELLRSCATGHVVRHGNYRGAISIALREAIARLRLERRISASEKNAPGRADRDVTAESSGSLRHEINNPLTGILGNAELILQGRAQLPAHLVQRVETIVELAVRLRKLMRSMEGIGKDLRERPAEAMTLVGSMPGRRRHPPTREE